MRCRPVPWWPPRRGSSGGRTSARTAVSSPPECRSGPRRCTSGRRPSFLTPLCRRCPSRFFPLPQGAVRGKSPVALFRRRFLFFKGLNSSPGKHFCGAIVDAERGQPGWGDQELGDDGEGLGGRRGMPSEPSPDLAHLLSHAERRIVRRLAAVLAEEGCSVEEWRGPAGPPPARP